MVTFAGSARKDLINWDCTRKQLNKKILCRTIKREGDLVPSISGTNDIYWWFTNTNSYIIGIVERQGDLTKNELILQKERVLKI